MTASNPFWEFSLSFYARPGVSPACLALQDEFGVDVNLLLFCLWRAADGEALTPGLLAELDAVIGSWRAEVVQPIRDLRRGLRDFPGIDSTRDMLKEAELESERVQQQQMYEWQLRRDAPGADGGRQPLSANLELYALSLELEPGALVAVEELARKAGIAGR